MDGVKPAKTAPVLGLILAVILALPGLCACNTRATSGLATDVAHPAIAATDAERDCLGRAMYFESKRTDADGLLAVGTVVMNRVEAAPAPAGICDVVGEPRQFATGVLTKPMAAKDLQSIADVADAVLAGERHPKVGRAMHFHTAGRRYPYDNMRYVAVAGGNAFYEKRKRGATEPDAPTAAMVMTAPQPQAVSTQMAYAAAAPEPEIAAAQTILSEPAQDICRIAAIRGG